MLSYTEAHPLVHFQLWAAYKLPRTLCAVVWTVSSVGHIMFPKVVRPAECLPTHLSIYKLYSYFLCSWDSALLIYSSNYNQQHAMLYNILYYVNALHVSGGFSAHHQELKNCTHSIGYMPSLLAATASGIYPMLCVKFLSSWWWAEKPPERCTALT